jgi:hypothetical protein
MPSRGTLSGKAEGLKDVLFPLGCGSTNSSEDEESAIGKESS